MSATAPARSCAHADGATAFAQQSRAMGLLWVQERTLCIKTFGRDTRRRFAAGLIRAEDEIVDGLALRKPRRQSFRVERLADRIGGEGGPTHELVRIFCFHQV